MTHRYPTRFQVKKATASAKTAASTKTAASNQTAESKNAAAPDSWPRWFVSMTSIFPMKASTVAHVCTNDCQERQREIDAVKPLIEAASKYSLSRREKVIYAIKLFHYFENHHHLLQHYPQFRQTTLGKIVEFRQVKEEEERAFKNMHRCDNCEKNYIKHVRLLGMLDVLMESCDRVYQIILNL